MVVASVFCLCVDTVLKGSRLHFMRWLFVVPCAGWVLLCSPVWSRLSLCTRPMHSLRWFRVIGLVVVPCAGSVLLPAYQLLWPFEAFYAMGLIALLLFWAPCAGFILLAVHQQWTCFFEAFYPHGCFWLHRCCVWCTLCRVIALLFIIHGRHLKCS